MAKRNIKEEFNSITFPDKKEYRKFEELILAGTEQSTQEAFKMLKNKIDSKKRRKSQRDQSGGLW